MEAPVAAMPLAPGESCAELVSPAAAACDVAAMVLAAAAASGGEAVQLPPPPQLALALVDPVAPAGEPVTVDLTPPRPRRHVWGPPVDFEEPGDAKASSSDANAEGGADGAAAGGGGEDAKPKKRRTRWETPAPVSACTDIVVAAPPVFGQARIIPGQLPREIVICNGTVKVRSGGSGGPDGGGSGSSGHMCVCVHCDAHSHAWLLPRTGEGACKRPILPPPPLTHNLSPYTPPLLSARAM